MGVCFVSSGGKKTGGYIKKVVKAFWDKKGLSVQEKPTLISQSECIHLNNLLTEMERGEIVKMVRYEIA